MNAAQIRKRLADIASEMTALAAAESMTAEQESAYQALETEAEDLEAKLTELESTETRQARQQRAAELAQRARASSRVTEPNAISRIRDSIQDDPQRGFRSLAEFAVCVRDYGANPMGNDRLARIAAGTGLQQSVNADGGVLVPPAFSKTIWTGAMQESDSLLSRCDVIPVDAGVESITLPAPAETSRVDGSRQGGIRGYWKSELTQMTSSAPKLRDVKIEPQELYVFTYISDKMLRNAPQAASAYLERGARDEINFKVGQGIIEGDGVGKLRGVMNHAATVSVAKESGQAAATIVPANIRKMMARLMIKWQQGAIWLVNPDVIPVLEGMEFQVGTGGVPAYLPPGGMADAPYGRLYGKPVVPCEYCNTVGTEGDIILTNLKGYVVGLKGLVDASYSMHLKFDHAQTAYRVIFELNGQPWLESAITPAKGANTVGTTVTLATRA